MSIIRGMIVTMTLLSWQMSLTLCRIPTLAAPTPTPIVIVMGKLLIRIQKLQDPSKRRVLTICHQFRATVRFAT